MTAQTSAYARAEPLANLINLNDLQRKLASSLKPATVDEATGSDLPAALDLVYRAADAMEALQKRARETEEWALHSIRQLEQQLADASERERELEVRIRASEQLARDVQTQFSASEQRAERAEQQLVSCNQELSDLRSRQSAMEARALRAEEKASKSEAWLAHTQDVITSKLGSFASRAASDEKSRLLRGPGCAVQSVVTEGD